MNRGLSTEQEQPQSASTMSRWTRLGLLWKRVWTSLRLAMAGRSGTGEKRPQHEPSTSTWTRFGLWWMRVWTSMRSTSSTGEERPQPEPGTPPHSTLFDGIQTSGTSNSYPQYVGQEPEEGEKSGSEDQPQDGHSSSGSAQEHGKVKKSEHENSPQDEFSLSGIAQEQVEGGNPALEDQPQDEASLSGSVTRIDENEKMVITNIRVTDVVLGLRRFPSRFYTIIRHSGLEWGTENECSSVQDDAVEWNKPLPM
ncbi:hypothetical protein EV363DRAFT_1168685 [Boletus edulis]|nr:hypothetical protein EV363DRAFT_1168685 [Boletus edulis]